MCKKCLLNSQSNLNNAQAVMMLAQAAHALNDMNATAAKDAILKRIELTVAPQDTVRGGQATDTATAGPTNTVGEDPVDHMGQFPAELRELLDALGVSGADVEVFHFPRR